MPPKKRRTYRKPATRKPAKRRTVRRRQYGGERILTEEELMRGAVDSVTSQPLPRAPPPRNDYYITGVQNLKWFAPPALLAAQGKWGDAWDSLKHQTKNWLQAHKLARTASTTLNRWGFKRLGDWVKSKGWGKKKKPKRKPAKKRPLRRKKQVGGMINPNIMNPNRFFLF